MDVFSDKSTLGLTSLRGSSPTRERGCVRPIYQPFCARAFFRGTRMQPAGSPQKRWKWRACSTWRKLQTSERSHLLHNLLFKTILRALDLGQPSLGRSFQAEWRGCDFSCITASTDVMQKLYLEIDSPYKASRAFNKYALNLAPLYSLSYLNFSCCEGIHMQ